MKTNNPETTDTCSALKAALELHFKDRFSALECATDMFTMELMPQDWLQVAAELQQKSDLAFEMLTDLCGVDYLHYGVGEWRTDTATSAGFSRAVQPQDQLRAADADQPTSTDTQVSTWHKPRFAVVYHLLSITHNWRLRVRVLLDEASALQVSSVTTIWPAANWYEREAFDLYGIEFVGHPDLRRLLTDYGFVGHPFRKDFPLIGEVEMRYDATLARCVYEPVSIEPRVLVPKVIRSDNRYIGAAEAMPAHDETS